MRAVGAVGRRGFGHVLEACKNFLCSAVSGGSPRAGWGVGGEGGRWGVENEQNVT